MKKNQMLLLTLLLLFSMISGTAAVYTRDIPFLGTIVKVKQPELPPPPVLEESIISQHSSSSVEVLPSGIVQITGTGDYLKLVQLLDVSYRVSVYVKSLEQLEHIGVYVDGYYEEALQLIHADVIQLVKGRLEMKRRTFHRYYDETKEIAHREVKEGSPYHIISDDIAAMFPQGWKDGFELSVELQRISQGIDDDTAVVSVMIDGRAVIDQAYPTCTPLYHEMTTFIGVRSWNAAQVVYERLRIEAIKHDAASDVIVPGYEGVEQHPNITQDEHQITIKNQGDFLLKVNNIHTDSYVVSVRIQVSTEANASLLDQLKGLGIYIDGRKDAAAHINVDSLLFSNDQEDSTNALYLYTHELRPQHIAGKTIYQSYPVDEKIKVTTRGEMGLNYDSAKEGFYLIAAVNGDLFPGRKQVRVFTADKNFMNMKEVQAYYSSNALPPVLRKWKQGNELYIGFHANHNDGRSIIFSDYKVEEGISSIP